MSVIEVLDNVKKENEKTLLKSRKIKLNKHLIKSYNLVENTEHFFLLALKAFDILNEDLGNPFKEHLPSDIFRHLEYDVCRLHFHKCCDVFKKAVFLKFKGKDTKNR